MEPLGSGAISEGKGATLGYREPSKVRHQAR
jgi:hypothetical protein